MSPHPILRLHSLLIYSFMPFIDWLVNRLIRWWVDFWLIQSLFSPLIKWLNHSFATFTSHWLINWFIHSFTNSPSHWLIDSFIHSLFSRFIHSFTNFSSNWLIYSFRDALITSVINCFTSFLAGFVVFSVLGYMSFILDKPIKTVAEEGPGLVFVAYPQVVRTME